jgi:hypothetical protein
MFLDDRGDDFGIFLAEPAKQCWDTHIALLLFALDVEVVAKGRAKRRVAEGSDRDNLLGYGASR